MIILRIIPHSSRWAGVTLGELVLTKAQPSPTTLRHEAIHVRQYRELLYVGFLVLYVLEFGWRYYQYRRWNDAYRAISFEREAYLHQHDPYYLQHRQHYAWRIHWHAPK